MMIGGREVPYSNDPAADPLDEGAAAEDRLPEEMMPNRSRHSGKRNTRQFQGMHCTSPSPSGSRPDGLLFWEKASPTTGGVVKSEFC